MVSKRGGHFSKYQNTIYGRPNTVINNDYFQGFVFYTEQLKNRHCLSTVKLPFQINTITGFISYNYVSLNNCIHLVQSLSLSLNWQYKYKSLRGGQSYKGYMTRHWVEEYSDDLAA